MSETAHSRREKDRFFRDSSDSPLPGEQRAAFAGLDYYEENPDLRFELELEPAEGDVIVIQTSDDRTREYTREARVSFQVAGQQVSLVLYGTGHPGLFLPFRDATSGTETYGAGRFLDIDPESAARVVIDFNLAYNPYCAYSDGYSCPLPPVENWLTVPIRAGEKSYRPPAAG